MKTKNPNCVSISLVSLKIKRNIGDRPIRVFKIAYGICPHAKNPRSAASILERSDEEKHPYKKKNEKEEPRKIKRKNPNCVSISLVSSKLRETSETDPLGF